MPRIHGSKAAYQLKTTRFSSHSLILKMAGAGDGRRAIDLGCGEGFIGASLREQGWTVDGVEIDPSAAEIASAVLNRVLVADVGSVPPEGLKEYDLAIFGDILEHTPDPGATLRGWLDSGGSPSRVIISVPNIAHMHVRTSLLLGRFQYQDRGILDKTHLHFFTRKSFLEMLEACGLEVLQFEVSPAPVELAFPRYANFFGNGPLHRAHAGLARRLPGLFAYQFVVMAAPISATSNSASSCA